MLEKINAVSLKIEDRIDTNLSNESNHFKDSIDLLYDLIDSNLEILKLYSGLSKTYEKELSALFITNLVVDSLLEDAELLSINSANDMITYLSSKTVEIRYNFPNEEYNLDFNIGTFITLCNFGGYTKTINNITKELTMYIFNKISCSVDYDIDEFRTILQNMKTINEELNDHNDGILSEMYAGIEKVKNGKITDVIPERDLQHMIGASRLFFDSQKQSEFGNIFCNALENNCNKPGLEAFTGLYNDISQEPEIIASVVTKVMADIQVGDVPVEEAIQAMNQGLYDNRDKFKADQL